MKFNKTNIEGLYTIDLNPFKDDRGSFGRTFCENEFKSIGFNDRFVQINHSFNTQKGTLRGMHFQLPPYGETKLIRCIAGMAFDVAVDLRKNSLTFLQWEGVELSAENKRMILIPKGFAHGFITLEDNTELLYHHTEFYIPEADTGFNYNDSRVNINWPIPIEKISEKDRILPDIEDSFEGI